MSSANRIQVKIPDPRKSTGSGLLMSAIQPRDKRYLPDREGGNAGVIMRIKGMPVTPLYSRPAGTLSKS